MENHRSAANGELTSGFYHLLMRFITSTFSGAITGLFALAGGFTGALTGALAGKASDTGVLRGAGLGAIAGAVLSVEILEASRAYWCLERSSSWSSSSMADFMEELLDGRFVEEQLPPDILTAHNEQVINFTEQASLTNLSYDETYNINSEIAVRGLSRNSLRNLPCFAMLDGLKATESICSICLQDIEVGEIARSLPQCHHMFHLSCVDKWLTRQGSCPMCRHDV